MSLCRLLAAPFDDSAFARSGAPGDGLDAPDTGWSTRLGRAATGPGSPGAASSAQERLRRLSEDGLVAGKYRLVRVLGQGAMGIVVEADDLLLARKVAIKFLMPEALAHQDANARFVREARAAAALRSEHVVRVIDVAVLDGTTPYLVMEYLEGCDLAAWLARCRRLPPEDATELILQACDALAEAHAQGIIHRDIKPANLFRVDRAGASHTVKVLDFGISKAPGQVAATVSPHEWNEAPVSTQEKVPIGSPCYMSPEQMDSARDVDARSDIWSLGVTLFELVTGHLPYPGQSLVQVHANIQSGSRLNARALVPELPRGLEAVICKCLERDRDRRYTTVSELTAALQGARRRPSMSRLRTPANESPGSNARSPGTGRKSGPRDGDLAPPGDRTLRSETSSPPAPLHRRSSASRLLLPVSLLVAVGTAVAVLVARAPHTLGPGASSTATPSPIARTTAVAPATALAPAPPTSSPERQADRAPGAPTSVLEAAPAPPAHATSTTTLERPRRPPASPTFPSPTAVERPVEAGAPSEGGAADEPRRGDSTSASPEVTPTLSELLRQRK